MTDSQELTAPASLVTSMQNSLVAAGVDSNSPTAADLVRAGEVLLERVLASNCDKREAALDLLTVDALFTRALEVAVKDDDHFDAFALDMMKRISDFGR
jgi:hypothetical protein